MVTPGLYCGLMRTPRASATFPNKANKHFVPFLPNLDFQGHQTWVAVSLDLCPQNAPYNIVLGKLGGQRVWASTSPDLLHTTLGGLALFLGLEIVLLQ